MRFSTIVASFLTIAAAVAAPTHKVPTCNAQGYITRTGVSVNSTVAASSASDCTAQCVNNASCRAVSYDDQNGCKFYTVGISSLQFTKQANPDALLQYQSTFWSRWCFNQTATTTSATSSSSTLAATSTTSSSSSSTAASTTTSSASTPAATSNTPAAATTSAVAAPTCSSVSVGGVTYNQYFASTGVTLSALNPGANTQNPKDGRYVKEILYGVTDACTAIQTCAGLSSYYGWVFGSFDVHYMEAESLWVCSTFANSVTAAEANPFWNVANTDVGVAFGFSM